MFNCYAFPKSVHLIEFRQTFNQSVSHNTSSLNTWIPFQEFETTNSHWIDGKQKEKRRKKEGGKEGERNKEKKREREKRRKIVEKEKIFTWRRKNKNNNKKNKKKRRKEIDGT